MREMKAGRLRMCTVVLARELREISHNSSCNYSFGFSFHSTLDRLSRQASKGRNQIPVMDSFSLNKLCYCIYS